MRATKQPVHISLEYEQQEPNVSDPHDDNANNKPLPPFKDDAEKSTKVFSFYEVARLASEGDNVAIASRILEQGTLVRLPEHFKKGSFLCKIDSTVLEGHRFAVEEVNVGDQLLSWGYPFGVAIRPMTAGSYICNDSSLAQLKMRKIEGTPSEANFVDMIPPYNLDEATFVPGKQVPILSDASDQFEGFVRPGKRGVGTRNYIVLLGTSSLSASFVRSLAQQFNHVANNRKAFPNVDGVVAVSHTEGGVIRSSDTEELPNNYEMVLRTLSGFIVNPNVGAVLVVDYGNEAIGNSHLQAYLAKRLQQGEDYYDLANVRHKFITITDSIMEELERSKSLIQEWVAASNKDDIRTLVPCKYLKIGLQCGGSDAFSGVSANPLAAAAAKETVCRGGIAGLAETDELIGAEKYMLENVKDLATAKRFLEKVSIFKERVAWHGHSAEGNPSGGNKLRGLYNICLKSLGAAVKRAPEVRLDHVIDYSEPMLEPGYYFMDSPGNDLESTAGQVASGANVIIFTTGNGSVTNFPFVPTVKVVTTTARFQLLEQDMDINAGEYLDGAPLPELGRRLFEFIRKVASGLKTAGEKAGHSQVSIWRDWYQTGSTADASRPDQTITPDAPSYKIKDYDNWLNSIAKPKLEMIPLHGGDRITHVSDLVDLILPTSICSSQIAHIIAESLNAEHQNEISQHAFPISKFLALPHTEGCGASGGESEDLYVRTMIGHLTQPLIRRALLLEHGCEKTHNSYMQQKLGEMGLLSSSFGFASVQLDGGIQKVKSKVEAFFHHTLQQREGLRREGCSYDQLRIGIAFASEAPAVVISSFAKLACFIINAGGTLVLPRNLDNKFILPLLKQIVEEQQVKTSLSYGQKIPHTKGNGLHVMNVPSNHWMETVTGLAASGLEVILTYVAKTPLQCHPLVPVLQVTSSSNSNRKDFDLILPEHDQLAVEDDNLSSDLARQVLNLVVDTCSRRYLPILYKQGYYDFQITRGLYGVSL